MCIRLRARRVPFRLVDACRAYTRQSVDCPSADFFRAPNGTRLLTKTTPRGRERESLGRRRTHGRATEQFRQRVENFHRRRRGLGQPSGSRSRGLGVGRRHSHVGVVGQLGGALAGAFRMIALGQRLQPPNNPFHEPGFVAGPRFFAEHFGVARPQLADGLPLERRDLFSYVQIHAYLLGLGPRKPLTRVDTEHDFGGKPRGVVHRVGVQPQPAAGEHGQRLSSAGS